MKKEVDPLDTMILDREPDFLVEAALANDTVLQHIVKSITQMVQKGKIREKGFKTLLLLAENHPQVLLPYWDILSGQLVSPNKDNQYVAVHIIAQLVESSKTPRFEEIFDLFFSRIDEDSLVVAAHTAGVAGKIACALPALQDRIVTRLINMNPTQFDAGRQDLIRSYAVESLDTFYETAPQKEEILGFVRRYAKGASPRARKVARGFLEKYGER